MSKHVTSGTSEAKHVGDDGGFLAVDGRPTKSDKPEAAMRVTKSMHVITDPSGDHLHKSKRASHHESAPAVTAMSYEDFSRGLGEFGGVYNRFNDTCTTTRSLC